MVLPFKWILFGRTFACCYFFLRIIQQQEIWIILCIFTFTTISNERVWIIHLIKHKEREMPIILLKSKKLTYRIFFIKVFWFCLEWLDCCPFAVVLCSNSTPSVNFESTNWQKKFYELAMRDYTKTDCKRRGREEGLLTSQQEEGERPTRLSIKYAGNWSVGPIFHYFCFLWK